MKKKNASGTLYGHEYVDLGLPSGVKWATCNVGASSPSDYGDYYAWGETTPKTEYQESNSKTYNKKLGDISGNPEYDAARANWGGRWRLPSVAEFKELRKKCTWIWTRQGGHYGYKVTGPNGNSIFLPATGFRLGTKLLFEECGDNYWSSTSRDSNGQYAYFGDRQCVNWEERSYGYPVRPVLGMNNLYVPQNVRGIVDNGKITITWDAVNNAAFYKIFRSAYGNRFSLVGISSTNSFTDNYPLSGPNFYRVQAFRADNASSKKSVTSQPFFSMVSDYNGHEYVDLGLPSGVKWATCNIGASSPSDYGDYFRWGETTPKAPARKYKSFDESIGDISGNFEYDAARYNWGGRWRLPSEAELKELIRKCTWTWTSQGGHKGFKVTGPNGNSIFLPAAGGSNESSLYHVGELIKYWSSTPDGPWHVYYLCNYFFCKCDTRRITVRSCCPDGGGCSVRPVSE